MRGMLAYPPLQYRTVLPIRKKSHPVRAGAHSAQYRCTTVAHEGTKSLPNSINMPEALQKRGDPTKT